jgi:hypothetical protein
MDKMKVELLMRAALQINVEDRAWTVSSSHLLEFAELVAAHEREACAMVCETHAPTTTPTWVSYAAAIRARSNL